MDKQKEARRKWRLAHPEKERASSLRYYYKHREELVAKAKLYRQEHIEELKIKDRVRRKELKLKALTYYSVGEEPICANCGITDIDVLCIDHIEGGGNAHRRAIGGASGNGLYKWLKKNNYPIGFQVLCANCNLKKQIRLVAP